MNKLILGAVTSILCSFPIGCFAYPGCEKTEYAQYKDRAQTASGQESLAFDYCRFTTRYETARKLVDHALQYRQLRDAQEGQRDMASCISEREKISDALSAAKATKARMFMLNGCKGG